LREALAKVNKTVDYINELYLNKVAEKLALGDKLKDQYRLKK